MRKALICAGILGLVCEMFLTGMTIAYAQQKTLSRSSTCKKFNASELKEQVKLKCATKASSVIKKLPLKSAKKFASADPSLVPAPDFEMTRDNGFITAEIASEDLKPLVNNYGLTGFVIEFIGAAQSFIQKISRSEFDYDEFGNLDIDQPGVLSGTWNIELAGLNASGQGPWSYQTVTIAPQLQQVAPPDFTLSTINGNLTASIPATEVQNSLIHYQTTAYVAQFTSPSGNVESASYSIGDDHVNAQLSIANPSVGIWSVEIAGINSLGQGGWSPPQTFAIQSPTPVMSLPIKLSCGQTPTTTSKQPLWVETGSSQLTTNQIASGTIQVSWCPASVVSTGPTYGPIIYTVTLYPGGESCTTWTDTSCTIYNAPPGEVFPDIIASNLQGNAFVSDAIITNSGSIDPCVPDGTSCFPGPINDVFATYGNTSAQISDCTFAAAADWEELNLGNDPDPTEIGIEFSQAGGTESSGLTADALFNYWRNQGIAGHKISGVSALPIDEIDVEKAILKSGELLAAVNLSSGQTTAGQYPIEGYHMFVVDGFTPQGPVIVTWGQTLQMTWQQWTLEATNLWQVNS